MSPPCCVSFPRSALTLPPPSVPVEQWGEDLSSDDVDWESKTDRRLLWRGRNTGGYFSTQTPWRDSHRARLAKMVGFGMEQEVEVLPSPGSIAGVIENGETLGNVTREEKMGRLNEMMFDIGLAYEPIREFFFVPVGPSLVLTIRREPAP